MKAFFDFITIEVEATGLKTLSCSVLSAWKQGPQWKIKKLWKLKWNQLQFGKNSERHTLQRTGAHSLTGYSINALSQRHSLVIVNKVILSEQPYFSKQK